MKELTVYTLLTVFSIVGYTQELTQVVRGKIVDQDSKIPLIGVNVIILHSNPIKGSVSDVDGKFRIEDVPVGRLDLAFSSIGYEYKTLPNLLVKSGKELVLDVEMIENLEELDEVVITAERKKGEVLNEMAMISSRQISVEETKRYAGSFSDPARMVSAFAGVTSSPEGNNDIIVRGNSPKGILWRMEGVEIPNPNHFSDEGSTGGAISALNSAVLANSDFYTGAFAPEYGNAFSGVLDMKLRDGNNEKREYSIGAGVLGVDGTLEGPFSQKSSGSYLLNFRYSSLALLDEIGVVDFGGVPKYMDAAFKMNLPTSKTGTFSLFGMGGKSNISEESNSELLNQTLSDKYSSYMGVLGLNHTYIISEKTFLQSSVSLGMNGSAYKAKHTIYQDSLNGEKIPFDKAIEMGSLEEVEGEDSKMDKYSWRYSIVMNNKIDARNRLKSGVVYHVHSFDFHLEDYYQETKTKEIVMETDGQATLFQGYTSWKHRFNKKLSMVSGVHALKFSLANKWSIEPRLASKWQFKDNQAINIGFGIVSKHESLTNYYSLGANGQQLNSTIEPLKARHYVIGYERNLSRNLLAKFDLYYQDLYNIPVENDPNSNYSVLNQSEWFVEKQLVNNGTGKNYGAEITLERFYDNNFYFLFSGSVYNSTYTALDGIERNTKYNGNFATNFLIGKEFRLGNPDKNRTLSLNAKFFYTGGQWFIPVDRAALVNGIYEYDNKNAWTKQGDNVFQFNFSTTLRRDKKKTSRELVLDILNTTNNDAKLYEYIDNGKVEYQRQLGIIPNLMYRVNF